MKRLLFILAFSTVAAAGGELFVLAAENSDIENIEQIFPTSTPDDGLIQSTEDGSGVQDLSTPSPVPDIASESESLGDFGLDDSSVNDAYEDLIDSVDDAGFDFFSPTPSSDVDITPSPEVSSFPSETPFPVYSDDDGDIDPYSSYNTYYGGISTTYLEFMRGFLPKLGFKDHYVASRTSQYNYIFAYGEDLSFSGSSFHGSNITVVTWNTYNNGSYSYSTESSFSLYPGAYLVYSDLSNVYPSLADTAGFTLRQILILLTTFILGIVIDHMYQVRKIRRIKGK